MDGIVRAAPSDQREEQCLDRMRAFERWYEFYLRKSQRLASNEDFSANDIRVLQEVFFAGGGASGAWLAYRLDLDEGYLCRILQKLTAYGFAASQPNPDDGRLKRWALTDSGREVAESVEREYRERTRWSVLLLSAEDRRRLVVAMDLVERTLRRCER